MLFAIISRHGEAQPITVALAAVRNVEIERKAIQRVTYRQQFSDPLPTTELSGDVEVARIVLSLDGDAPTERLTETWAPVFVCMERFGKVRTFLRAHGWLPLPEREPLQNTPAQRTPAAPVAALSARPDAVQWSIAVGSAFGEGSCTSRNRFAWVFSRASGASPSQPCSPAWGARRRRAAT